MSGIAHTGDMSQPAHKPVPEPTLNGYRVLVIDDEQALADLVGSYLTRDGFELSTARDGQQAIDQARQVDPDVMVLDLGLPVIDSVEVCRLDLSGHRAGFGHRVAHVLRHRLPGAVVAAVTYPARQLGDIGAVRIVGDVRALRNGIRHNRQHPWATPQGLLHNGGRRRPVQAADLQDCV